MSRLDRFESTAKDSGLSKAVDLKNSFQLVQQQRAEVIVACGTGLRPMRFASD